VRSPLESAVRRERGKKRSNLSKREKGERKNRMETPYTEKMEQRNIMRKDVNETWKMEKARKLK
jgi:hypothetical protein